MSKLCRSLKIGGLFAVLVIGLLTLMPNDASAADYSGLMKKWMITQYRACLVDSTNGINTTVNRKTDNTKVVNSVFKNTKTLYLPSYNLAGKVSLNCREVATNGGLTIGQSVWDAAAQDISEMAWSNYQKAQTLMTDVLGYTGESHQGEAKFKIQAYRTRTVQSCDYNMWSFIFNNACHEATTSKAESTPTMTISAPENGTRKLSVSNWDNWFAQLKLTTDNNTVSVHVDESLGCHVSNDHSASYKFDPSGTPQELYNKIEADLPNRNWTVSCSSIYAYGDSPVNSGTVETTDVSTYSFGVGDLEIVDHSDIEKFSFNNSNASNILTALKTISGGVYASNGDMYLNQTEKYILYTYYLDKIASGPNRITCNPTNTANLTPVKMLDATDSTFKTCYVNLSSLGDENAIKNLKVYTQVVDATTKVATIGQISLYDMINWMNNDMNTESIDIALVDATVDSNTPEGEEQESVAKCSNSGGVLSLTWIVCPILDWMGSAAEGIYTGWLEPALQIEPKLFAEWVVDTNDSDHDGDRTELVMQFSETKGAWDKFQLIANICFIILFLVVIFSQLTGVGIDNYGIKRILPKLIIAAILINLSYYICVIAVDISNILGSALKALFDNLATMPEIKLSSDGVETLGSAGQTISAVALLVMLIGATGLVFWQNPAIILSLLVTALGVLISVIFLFVLLASREAAIVVLTVISPLAFTCYMLPNTKKLFDKWVSIGKGLLLVYPIAGLLIGGGNFVSNLLMQVNNGEGFWMTTTAMVAGIVPIFFIPTVLKNSFAALGSLGAKISGFGDKMRSGADRKIRSSEGFKDTSNRWRAGVNRNGDLTRVGKWRAQSGQSKFAKKGVGRLLLGGVSRSQTRGMAAAGKTRAEDEAAGATLINAMAKEEISKSTELAGLGSSFGARTEGAYYGQRFLDSARKGDASGMGSAIEAMRASNMKSKDIAKLVRYAENNGGYGFKDENARASWYRDLSKKYGGDFLATDYELGSFAMQGGSGGKLGNYGEYAPGNIGMDDIKPEELGKLSGDSLAGMLSSGLIDSSMAQRAIDISPNLSADKKIMLSAIANGASVASAVGTSSTKAGATQIEKFKDEAAALLQANAAGAIGGLSVSAEMSNAWKAVTPKDMNIAAVGGVAQPDQILQVREVGGQEQTAQYIARTGQKLDDLVSQGVITEERANRLRQQREKKIIRDGGNNNS